MNHELLTSIENQTLAHFRHFRHFSSLLTNLPSTTVEDSLQIKLFMQNEPNFRKSQMNVTDLLTRVYEKMDTWWSGKNEPKTNPIKANFTSPKSSRKAELFNGVYKPGNDPREAVICQFAQNTHSISPSIQEAKFSFKAMKTEKKDQRIRNSIERDICQYKN
jgi:hypothetical protein